MVRDEQKALEHTSTLEGVSLRRKERKKDKRRRIKINHKREMNKECPYDSVYIPMRSHSSHSL